MTWDPALWPVIRIAIIALLAFIVVTIIAWPGNKAVWSEFRKRRVKRPAPPPAPPSRMPPLARPQVVQGYELVFNLLRFTGLQKEAFDRAIAAQGDEDSPSRRRLERRRSETVDTFAGLRDAAARFLGRMTDEDLAAIADFMSRSPEYCDGLVAPEECVEFMKSERALIAGQPYLAVSHQDRLNGSGPGKLAETRRLAEDAAGHD